MNAFIIIAVIVLLALAPLWHFRPTRGQRRQARLRETAAMNGLFVEFRDLPLPPARRERLPAAERQVLYYGCRLRPRRGDPVARVVWWREGEDWSSMPPRSALPLQASRMPAAVLAMDTSAASCGAYWRVEGDEQTVEQLAALLRDWRDEITPA